MKRILLALVALLLSGCASFSNNVGGVQPANSISSSNNPQGLPNRAFISNVPFYTQETNMCGPAALAAALQFSGVPATPDELVTQVYTPALKGSLQFDLLGATRKAGRIPYVIHPDLTTLFREVAAGNPVLVLQNVGFIADEWHFAVVVGYDLQNQQIALQSGTTLHLILSIAAFDRTWSDAKRWGFVALPPEKIPASATEPEYLRDVSPIESINPAVARVAYQTSLSQWPYSLVALIGLGNMAYNTGEFTAAEGYFLEASTRHPDSADALNNLAQTYLAQGKYSLALDAIRRAISLGGPRSTLYQATLRQIESETSSQEKN